MHLLQVSLVDRGPGLIGCMSVFPLLMTDEFHDIFKDFARF